MYVVAIFALALLSPLPFVSPFVYDVQNVEAQIPFDTSDRDISSPIETAPQKFDSYDLTSSTDNTFTIYCYRRSQVSRSRVKSRSRSIKFQPNCFSVDISYSGCYCRAFY